MRGTILLDTGPLAAFYDRRDKHHAWAWETFSSLQPPFITCDAVLTEACFLLSRNGGDPLPVIRAVTTGLLKPTFEISDESGALETLMARYANVPMSLADACLVRLSELHKNCRVFTLDRHFKNYRRYGRSVIPVLSPW